MHEWIMAIADLVGSQVLLSAGLETAPGGNGFGEYQSISWG